MIFNSLEFAIFLPTVFIIYWFVVNKNLKIQNVFLIIASYFFYGWWDWRFLSLIIFSSLVDYFVGLGLEKDFSQKRRKLLLIISLLVNLGFLGFFKYFNFFVDSFISAFRLFGQEFDPFTLKVVLPVGISFYTFQTLSYSIDVYRRKMKPTKDMVAFFAFVSFFPQLVAGPIERAANLLPQFYKKRSFDYAKAVDGSRQILWGLFKKIVIADNCAPLVNDIFSNYESHHSVILILGAVLFAFQIYGDFSGYSDIAIGTARLFGFNLMQNFAYPYFSRDIAEFWRRWHISLSTWFRDYLYIPLGGSRVSLEKSIRNVFIIFIVSGFWHGANWTFIVWGALNALYFLPLMIFKLNRKNTDTAAEGRLFPSFREIFNIVITFGLTTLAWIFFRAANVAEAFDYLVRIFQGPFFEDISFIPKKLFLFIFVLLIVEWFQRDKQHALEFEENKIPSYLRWSIYYVLIIAIFLFKNEPQDFIYFQF